MASAEVAPRVENPVEGEKLTNGRETNGDQSSTANNVASVGSDQRNDSPINLGVETSDDLNNQSDLVNGLAEAATNSVNTLLADSNSYKDTVDVFAINNMIQQMSVIDSTSSSAHPTSTTYTSTTSGGNWGRYPTADGLGNYSGGTGGGYDQYQRPFSGYSTNGSVNQSGMFAKRPITRGQQPQQPFNGDNNRQPGYGPAGKFQQQNWNQQNGQPQPGFGSGNYQGFSQWGNQQQPNNYYGQNQQAMTSQQQQQQQQQQANFRRCTSVPNHMGMRGGYMGSKSVEYSQAEFAAALADNGNSQNGGPAFPTTQSEMPKNGGSPTGISGSAGSSASPTTGQQGGGVSGAGDNNFVSGDLLESLIRTSHEAYKGPQQLGLLDENAPFMTEELAASLAAYGEQGSGASVFGVVPGTNGTSTAQQQQIQMAVASMGGGQISGGAFGNSMQGEKVERFSRKVFVGGLPPDIDEDEIRSSFQQFGALVVDWPHKNESRSYFPPKGYCFLLFQDELSVQLLINVCLQEKGRLFWPVSSPTMKDKMVQIRPWSLTDSDFVMDGQQPIDPRKTIFVGGVPRPLRASELAMIMNDLYGGVCYAGIDVDPELKYPKGAGRVAFSTQQAYIAAISARFVQLRHADIDKRVEVKPYVLDDQMCDECQGQRCSGKFAPFFCANVTCLQYYCEYCWAQIHSRPGREFHKPLVKEGADRPRAVPFRWY